MNPIDALEENDLPGQEGGSPESFDDGALPDGEIPTGPRKPKISAATLLMFGLLASVAGATYLMVLRSDSEDAFNPATATADTTISAFLGGGAQTFRQKIMMLNDTANMVAHFADYREAHQIPVSELRTNPFTAPEYRSVADTPSDADQQAEERAAAAEVMHGLKLDSIIYGSRSVCMINGRPYTEGQGSTIFTVVQIRAQSVVVRVGPAKFELKMAPAQTD